MQTDTRATLVAVEGKPIEARVAWTTQSVVVLAGQHQFDYGICSIPGWCREVDSAIGLLGVGLAN